ncbi:MAG: hypothetical protein J0J01_16335 [Reyranella sp.]|uniref:hypothetical protein n=1 Tax=Reyranella sp. TaxID=1929291 RepID=UPI001ACCFE3F|nr:hypothetical protein [Reyranella sp.]MBN9088474.1 hypothetical protein [Reyranella sp.]
MKKRAIAAILVVIIGAGIDELLPTVRSDTSRFQGQLPEEVGPFRLSEQKDYEGNIWGTYVGLGGYLADHVISYGTARPHDAVDCWQLHSKSPVWHELRTLRTASSAAIFDVAIFLDKGTKKRLIASTSCDIEGCRQSYAGNGWRWPTVESLGLVLKPPTPVAISIVGPPNSEIDALVSQFDSFVAGLDLAHVTTSSNRR